MNASRNSGVSSNNRYNSSLSLINKTIFNQQALLSQLGSLTAGVFSVYAVQRFVKELVNVRGEFEMQQVSLRAILQNAAAADRIFNQLQNLSIISPYAFKDLVGYAKQLSAFSIPVNEVYDTTKKLADVSSGLGVDMSRIILAYGQIRSASVLRGQELRQLTEAGIPVIDELIKKYGELGEVVSAGDIFDKISRRQVSFEMIKEMFDDLTKEGGKFYNMQEIQSMSLKGKVENLKDAFAIMFNSIGESQDDILKGSVDNVAALAQNWQDVWSVLKTLIIGYGIYKVAAIAVNGVNAMTITQLRRIAAAKNAVNSVMSINPVAGGIAGISILIGLYATWQAHQERINEELMKSITTINQQRDSVNGYIERLKELSLVNNADSKILAERKILLKNISEVEPEVARSIKDHADNLEILNKAQKDYNDLVYAQKFATYLINDGSGLFSNNLIEDLEDFKNVQGSADKEAGKLTLSYTRAAEAIEQFKNSGIEAFSGMNNLSQETLTRIDKVTSSSKTYAEKLVEIMGILRSGDIFVGYGEARASRNFQDYILNGDDSQLDNYAKAMSKLDKESESLKIRLDEAAKALRGVFSMQNITDEDKIRDLVKSLDQIGKYGQEQILIRLGIKWEGDDSPEEELTGWRKELKNIVGDVIEIKATTNMSDVMDDMSKKHKEKKEEIERLKPILIKLGFSFENDSFPEWVQNSPFSGFAKEAKLQFDSVTKDLNGLNNASKVLGVTFKDNEKKAKNTGDKVADAIKKQADLVKEAFSEYTKLQNIMSKAEALATVQAQDRYKGVAIPIDENAMFKSIEEFYKKANKLKSKEGKKLADSLQKEMTTGANDLIKKTFEEMSTALTR